MLVERFADDEYAWLNVSNRVVIDVGANVGDSVLYFTRRGARFVYAYEPEPLSHAAALRNVDANGVKNVHVRQAAITGIDRARSSPGACVSFDEAVRLAESQHPGVPIICKIDCEGCEHEIFVPGELTPSIAAGVPQIMIEYHGGSPGRIGECLERLGYQVHTEAAAPGVGWVRAHT